MRLPPLKIQELTARVPIIQGGMGIGCKPFLIGGCRGSGRGSASLCCPARVPEPDFADHPHEANLRALSREIHRAKEISGGGIIGVNIMCAMKNYEQYVKCCIDSGADLIISGAGLPTNLPELVKGSGIKNRPIVSPPKIRQGAAENVGPPPAPLPT